MAAVNGTTYSGLSRALKAPQQPRPTLDPQRTGISYACSNTNVNRRVPLIRVFGPGTTAAGLPIITLHSRTLVDRRNVKPPPAPETPERHRSRAVAPARSAEPSCRPKSRAHSPPLARRSPSPAPPSPAQTPAPARLHPRRHSAAAPETMLLRAAAPARATQSPPVLHPTDESAAAADAGTPVLHPTDEDLSAGTPVLHPTDEDLSAGAP